jgi:7-keto-8-aminopelargonate synthetase-like enzyme
MEDRKRYPLVAGVVVALALGGCGSGGGGGSSGTVSDPAAVRTAVAEFSKAFGAGDGKVACTLMTPEAQTALVKRVKSLIPVSTCAEAIAAVHGEAGAQVNIAFADATVSKVKVTGGSATAVLTASGHSAVAKLVKQGGAWKLTGVPGI